MLKEISGIEICGANFKKPTDLNLFDPIDGKKIKTIKGALLYGRNGSGKSTIARGFRQIAGEVLPTISRATIFDKDHNPIILSKDERKDIFVFDEEYVDKNVKLQEDHLETIVMLGEQVDLSEKIKVAKEECNAAKTLLDAQARVCSEYNDRQNIKCPQYYLLKLRWALQGDDSWAGRDKEIRNGRQNTGVRDDTYKQFLNITPLKPRSELILDFKRVQQDLEAARAGASIIEQPVPQIPDKYNLYDELEIGKLLSQKIERPEFSEREQFLLKLVRQKGIHVLTERKELLERPETKSCPYCLQELTPGYKDDLIQSIEKILNETVEDHRKILREKIWGEMYIDLFPFEKLDGFSTCKELIMQIDEAIKSNNNLLQQKIDNPYEPISTETVSIHFLLSQLTAALANLENTRIAYNKKAKSTDPFLKELTRINSEIAHYDIIDLAGQYDKQCEESKTEKARYESLKADYLLKEKAVQALEAQRSSVTVAIDVMNNYMKYIFFEEDRLRIEYDDGVYRLLSHGQKVKPREVSVGERNIIGLCYFFTSILKGKEEKDAYNDEYLIIVDDPISSYDMENRIGILSFLKYELSAFLEGNTETRVLVMTHDLMTFYDVHKILEEIIEKCKQQWNTGQIKFNRFELRDEEIIHFQYKSRHEYSELIQTIYRFGLGQAGDQTIVIGNIMRQVLEAFATFEFKKGIDKVSTDDDILSLLGCQEFKVYFKNLMYRLVLHGGSHKEEYVKSMNDLNFFTLISEKEKERTAKDILCFIYRLNKPHLLAHLKDVDPDAESKLNLWCQDIRKRSAAT